MHTRTRDRITEIERTRVGIIAGRFMHAFSGNRVTVVLCTGISIITFHRNMDATFLPIPAAYVYRAWVTVIAIHRCKCALACYRIAGIYGAGITIVTGGHIGTCACQRITAIERARITVITCRNIDTFASNRIAPVIRTWVTVVAFHRNMQTFPIVTDVRIPAADVYRTWIAIVAIERRKDALAGNRVTGIYCA